MHHRAGPLTGSVHGTRGWPRVAAPAAASP